MRRLGLLFPQDNDHAIKYPLKLSGIARVVEREIPYPKKLVGFYDQANNGCVGYSLSWAMTMLNTKRLGKPNIYIADWLYEKAQARDGFNHSGDDGTTLRAGFDVLRELGHLMPLQTEPSKGEGVERNEWAYSVDEIRTCIDDKVPVALGIAWYSSFDYPVQRNGEWWIDAIGGRFEGGHAIVAISASDERQAVKLLNSWGKDYPPVWISYDNVRKLLSWEYGGEASIPVDRLNKYKYNWE